MPPTARNHGSCLLYSIPPEICASILSFCTYKDTTRLKECIPVSDRGAQALRAECDRRMSVESYITSGLGNGKGWLDAMARSSVVLSGSRAAAFFVPQACNDLSDWDFYLSLGAIGSVEPGLDETAFIAETEKLGAEWLTPIKQLETMVLEGRGSMVVSHRVWYRMEGQGVAGILSRHGITTVGGRYREKYQRYMLRIEGNTVFKDPHEFDSEEYHPNMARLIRGVLRTGGRDVDLQLIVVLPDHYDGPLCFLSRFHSTCVQCFIGGNVACHLYGEMSSRCETYIWKFNADTRPRLAAALKYIERGFVRVSLPLPPVGFRMRNGGDELAISTPIYNVSDTSSCASEGHPVQKRREMRMAAAHLFLTWQETPMAARDMAVSCLWRNGRQELAEERLALSSDFPNHPVPLSWRGNLALG